MLTHGSLFSGIGGFDLGFERAGFRAVWQVELDAYCQAVLERHVPHAKRVSDIQAVGRTNLAIRAAKEGTDGRPEQGDGSDQ